MTEGSSLTKGPVAVLPGLALALAAFGLASLAHLVVPWIPALTACVVLGVAFTSLPWSPRVRAVLQPGFAAAARRLLRIGIVLLGLKLSLVDIAGLGWLVLGMIVLIVVATFVFTRPSRSAYFNATFRIRWVFIAVVDDNP